MPGPRKPFLPSSENPPNAADMAANFEIDSINMGQNGALTGNDSSLPEVESVFSQRSGIRDPLIKASGSSDSPGETSEREDSTMVGPKQDIVEAHEIANDNRPINQQPRDGHAKTLRVRRRKKKIQVFTQRLRLILKLAMALVWVVMLWELARSPMWKLDSESRFALENKHLITEAQIMPLIRPYVGKPLYLLDVGRLSREIKARFPVVANVAVRRQLFPARLNILLTEKRPWAEMYPAPPLFISPPAKPIKPAEKTASAEKGSEKEAIKSLASGKSVQSQPQSPPRLIFGEPYGLIANKAFIPLKAMPYRPDLYPGRTIERIVINPNTRYQTGYIQILRQFAWKARHLSSGPASLHLRWIDARRPDLVSLHFQETNVILGYLDATAEQRLVRIIALIPKINEFKGAIDSVDLRWEEQVTLHTKPNALIVQPDTEQPIDG